jgi:phospholipid/cholesterol/gamma-HCH transport system substrate-binding protein
MEEKVNYALVGLFVLVLGAALLGGVLWLSSGKTYSSSYDPYYVYMKDSVTGLSLNSTVRYRGVEVGKVRKIELAPNNVEQVRITLGILRGTPVKADTVAILQTHGLTGLAYVELSGGTQQASMLQTQEGEDYPVIKNEPSLMRRLDSSVTGLLNNLNRAADSLNAVLDEQNRNSLKKILTDLQTVTHTLAGRAPAIDSSLRDAAHTLNNTAKMSDDLPQLTQRVQRSAEAFGRMSEQWAQVGGQAASAVGGTQQFTRETLPEIHQLVQELRELTGSLRRVSDQLEQNPSAILYGKSKPKRGPGE